MRMRIRALARRPVAVALASGTAIVAATGGALVLLGTPAGAALPLPTISSVVVGNTTNRVVTAGTTVKISGTGFSGMQDNAADPACSVAPVAGSRCSQVRFNGISATTSANFTLATRYVVVSDTTIYAVVPTVAAIAPTAGAPAAGSGSTRVVVVNTNPAGTSSLSSVPGSGTTNEVLYRHPLTATLVSSPVAANPLGGGTINVDVGNVAPLTSGTGGTLAQEKMTAMFTSAVSGSPTISTNAVSFVDTNTVSITVPGGMPDGGYVDVMLLHDGILGDGDDDSLKYAAVITSIKTCSTTFTPPVTTPLPTCAGTANSAASTIHIMLTGRGFTEATGWDFDGADGNIGEDCAVYSDVTVYCELTVNQLPTLPVVTVEFAPGDADSGGPRTPPAQGQVGTGSVFSFS
jgi:hypothetical protein